MCATLRRRADEPLHVPVCHGNQFGLLRCQEPSQVYPADETQTDNSDLYHLPTILPSRHVDHDVLCYTTQDGVTAGYGLQDRSGHQGRHRPVRRQAGDEPLPAHPSTDVPIQPERAIPGRQDLRRSDGIGPGWHQRPIA